MAASGPSADLVPHIPSLQIKSTVGPAAAGKMSTLRFYLSLQTGRWWEWVLVWVLQNVRYCPVYILPFLTGFLIDRIDRHDPAAALRHIPWIMGVTVVLCAVTVAANTGARAILSRLGRSLTAGLRAALFRRMNRMEFSFHDRAHLGALQSKFTLDTGRLEGYQTFFAESLLMYGTVVVVMLGIIAWKNPILLLVLLVAVPLNLMLVRLFWNRIRALNEDYCHAETSFMSRLTEVLQGLRLIRAHANEQFAERRLAESAGEVAAKAIRLDLMNNLFGSGGWAVSTLLNMGVAALGIWLAVGGSPSVSLFGHPLAFPPITLGEFTILVSYYGIIAGAMATILGGMPAVAAAHDAIRSLSQLFNEEDEEANRHKRRIERVNGEVVFDGVRFAYPGADAACLVGIDLRIEPGSTLALVGSSGSGKSTIASLLLGFYRPQAGRILVDGCDLEEMDKRTLRHHIGTVSQEVVLFHDSILNNIAWGDATPDRARVVDAARRANAADFIERLPGGFDHVLADRGGGLSGGQRQRLAIARALYRDPRLLILDEATSALDHESERQVQAALEEVRRGRTTLVIAHRLSTVRSADRICVLAGGRVVEAGTFDELMDRDGHFRRLAKGQLV
jgi:ATP-binding cassette subfamily B protein